MLISKRRHKSEWRARGKEHVVCCTVPILCTVGEKTLSELQIIAWMTLQLLRQLSLQPVCLFVCLFACLLCLCDALVGRGAAGTGFP